MEEPVVVRIAEFYAGRGQGLMRTYALGSCVAIILYDSEKKVGALSHTMLPEPQVSLDEGCQGPLKNPAKFVDTAIPAMLQEMRKLGASQVRVVAKLVGGARMFPGIPSPESANIGERNADRARRTLVNLGVPLIAEDTGGTHGRSVLFNLKDGTVVISSLKVGERIL